MVEIIIKSKHQPEVWIKIENQQFQIAISYEENDKDHLAMARWYAEMIQIAFSKIGIKTKIT